MLQALLRNEVEGGGGKEKREGRGEERFRGKRRKCREEESDPRASTVTVYRRTETVSTPPYRRSGREDKRVSSFADPEFQGGDNIIYVMATRLDKREIDRVWGG